MITNSLISIIIPIYNIKEYLPICLNSLITQTYQNFEIILVDDGSTDGSSTICDEYSSKDSRIKVYHQTNAGQSVARNFGITESIGEYITFIDGDDWVSSDYLETLVNGIKRYSADVINCNYVRTRRAGIIKSTNMECFYTKEYNSEQAIENLCYLKELTCAPYAKLFKRNIWETIRFPEHEIYEDLAVIYKTFDKAQKIVYIDYDGYCYFQRQGSSLNNVFNEKKLSRIKFSKEIIAFVKQHYPRVVSSAYCRLFWSASGALMDLPRGYNNQIKKEIRSLIHESRSIIIKDSRCKLTVRILALLSYCGMFFYRNVLLCYRILKTV